jgi:excisionase family DNA binding protein
MDANYHAPKRNAFATVEETQKYCRVTRKTVEGWIESGELPHHRLGPRTIRIAWADLEKFLAERRYFGLPPGLRHESSTPDESPEDIRSRCSSPGEVPDDRTAAA